MSQASNRALLLAVLLLAALAVAGPSARGVARRAKERQGELQTPADIEERNSNAFAVILGEVRATAADLMFIKTERYLDSGVAYEPHLDAERMAETGEIRSHASGRSVQTPHPVQTVIRTAANDFRGFLGDLERAVKPYRDPSLPHQHTTGEELLPWYRLMTLANPRYIRGYMIGAMWLTQANKWSQARDFLLEGIAANRDNPELFRLYTSLSLIYVKARYNPSYGEKDWLGRALDAARKAVGLALVQRPEHGAIGQLRRDLYWREDLEEEFRFAGRTVAILLRDKRDLAGALAAAREFLSYAPDDSPGKALLKELGAAPSEGKTP